jgi:hypothetical protein
MIPQSQLVKINSLLYPEFFQMKKTRHSEEKIIAAVKQLEAGRAVKELAREMGVTDQTLYNWK